MDGHSFHGTGTTHGIDPGKVKRVHHEGTKGTKKRRNRRRGGSDIPVKQIKKQIKSNK
jgi:hypothetical protein